MNDNTKVLAAMLAGLAAGVAIGILFAPDKGSETRDKLTDSLKNLGDSIKDRAADEIGNLSEFKDKVVDGIKSKLRSAEDEYSKTRTAVNSAIDHAEDTLNKAVKS
jgi:gas vesicle protein